MQCVFPVANHPICLIKLVWKHWRYEKTTSEVFWMKQGDVWVRLPVTSNNTLTSCNSWSFRASTRFVHVLIPPCTSNIDLHTMPVPKSQTGNVIFCLLQLLEPAVTVRVREVDQNLVKGVVENCISVYKSNTGKDVVLKLDSESFLPVDSVGGIELLANRGRIKISNTLEARLDLIAQQLVPEIRIALFGRNPNRKFLD